MPGSRLKKSILLSAALALGILGLEVVTPRGVSESTLYVLVVLASLWSGDRRVIFGGILLSTALTALGFYLSPDGSEAWKSVTNRVFAGAAFWIVGLIGLQHQRTENEIQTINTKLEGIVVERTADLEAANEQLQRELTHRDDLAEALLKERDLLQALMNNIPDTIYFKDTQSRFTRINQAQMKFLGLDKPEDAIGKTDFDFQNPEIARGFYEEEQRIVQTGEPVMNRPEFNPTLDGQPRWFSATKVPVRDVDGQVIGIVGVSRDITQRKQAEEALRQSETKFRSLVEHLPAITYLSAFDESRTRLYVSPQNEAYLGFSSAEWLADPNLWRRQLHPEDRERVLAEMARFYRAGEPFVSEYRSLSRSGEAIWFHDEAVIVRDSNGEPQYIQGVKVNITERKNAEAALRRSEERFRLMAWATKDAVWDWDLETDQIWWGEGLQKLFHYSPDTDSHDSEWRLQHIHPEDREKVNRVIQQALEGGMEFWSKEYRFQRADGSYAEIMDRGYILRNDQGRPYRMVGAMMDMTERNQAESALNRSEETTRLLIDTALDGVIIIDRDGRITHWNNQAEAIFGWRRAEAMGQRLSTLIIPPELRGKHEQGLKHYLETGEGPVLDKRIEITAQRRNGDVFPVELAIHVLKANDEISFAAFIRDITERKDAEATINHQNEMLSSLHYITVSLLRYSDIGQLLNALVEFASTLLDAPYAEMMLLEGDYLVVKAATLNQRGLVGERVDRHVATLSWEAFDTHEPAVLDDYSTWPKRRTVYDEFQLHAVAEVPIMSHDQCLGVLSLSRDKPGHVFTTDQIQFGRLFADLTALVLTNAQLREALSQQSIRDPLTGLYNRRYMEEALNQQLSRTKRQLHPLGLIMLDIDHFKTINDTYGHATGDALLRELGLLLKNHVRNEDIACRYGGEEFLLILPDAPLDAAWQRAEYLRRELKQLQLRPEDGGPIDGITMSLGIAVFPDHGSDMDVVLRAADAALYRAKQEGRDRVVVAEPVA